ncbi:MAG: response regulator transcription factor [Bacteroidota bacterium]|nr:response regulator transcription factor [Bacteroidota bacterium]
MKILIADDHAIVRKGVIELLRKEFPGAEICEISDGAEAINKARDNTWDIILMDISMPGRSGIEALKQIRADGVKTPVLMLSMQPEDQYAIRVLKAGASGYVNKDCATAELIAAVHKVLAGRKYISPAVSEKLAVSINDTGKTGHELLSDREMQVLELIANGKTLSEIGNEISLSVNTISTYRARILVKLELHNNGELTRYALDNNLV